MENHLNAVLVLYTKKTGFATCFFNLIRNENFKLCIIIMTFVVLKINKKELACKPTRIITTHIYNYFFLLRSQKGFMLFW